MKTPQYRRTNKAIRGLLGVGVLCMLSFGVLLNGAHAAERVLKLASFVPPIYVLHKPIFEKLATDLDAATSGSTKIKIYPSGELGKGPVEQYKRAVQRIAEISYGLPGYTSSVFPKTLMIELPGVSNGHEDATAKLWNAMDSQLRGEFKRTRPLALFVTPPSVFMMRDKPVRSLADLAGLKIRVASKSAASIIEAYGATPVQMPANKVYTAMSTGVVDGALMGSDSLLIFKLIETTQFVTTNLPEMPTAIFLVMNDAAYQEMPAADRQALDKLTGLDISQRSAIGLADFGKLALKKFAAIDGKEIISLSAQERQAFDVKAKDGVAKVVADAKARGIDAGEVLAAFGK